ncbi:tail sheath protein [Salmonella phage ST-W77]|nr:tail sheath protein [Salmonella phage ST-W77]ARB12230.1 tail sheath protein [Salmonella phage ST-W77]QQO38991.1 tail sheath protein [Salmonella phage SPHG3]
MAEQNIAAIAKYYLGENNDAFTRGLFSNAVRPYIRQLANMGAIYDGKVKCDEDNNTADVIAANQMVAGIWLKPEYSINWVYLDFAAVRPDMEFSEIESGGGIVAAS